MTKGFADWRDDFPTKTLYLNDIEPYCTGWRRYRHFKLRVEPIAGNTFKRESDDFRNTYNHRFSSRFVMGLTRNVSRIEPVPGKIVYGFGGNDAFDLAEIADLLETERDKCYLAFESFKDLVAEHTLAIEAFETGQQA